MASTQDLKRRVRSITNTRKLTRAMELVASARLRRAQQRIEAMRPYADRMAELMAGTARATGAARLPLLERRLASGQHAGLRRQRALNSRAKNARPAPPRPAAYHRARRTTAAPRQPTAPVSRAARIIDCPPP